MHGPKSHLEIWTTRTLWVHLVLYLVICRGILPGWKQMQVVERTCRLRNSGARLELGAWVKPYKQGYLDEACRALADMGDEGIFITRENVVRVLKECIAKKDVVAGRHIHALTFQDGYEWNSFLATHLIVCMPLVGACGKHVMCSANCWHRLPVCGRQLFESILTMESLNMVSSCISRCGNGLKWQIRTCM